MSILKFDIVILDPHTTNNMNQLERVQRKLLRFSIHLLKIKHISIIRTSIPDYYKPVSNRLCFQSLANRQSILNNASSYSNLSMDRLIFESYFPWLTLKLIMFRTVLLILSLCHDKLFSKRQNRSIYNIAYCQ